MFYVFYMTCDTLINYLDLNLNLVRRVNRSRLPLLPSGPILFFFSNWKFDSVVQYINYVFI